MNDLAAKHKHEMATEKEKAIQVNKITLMSVLEKEYIHTLNMFFL